jgi:hypothetical protein
MPMLRTSPAKERVSVCEACGSTSLDQYTSEICIHFPGVNSLEKVSVLAFPKLVICLDCGFTRSTLSHEELQPLREEKAAHAEPLAR